MQADPRRRGCYVLLTSTEVPGCPNGNFLMRYQIYNMYGEPPSISIIVDVRMFVRSFVRAFVRSFVRMSVRHTFYKSFVTFLTSLPFN